MKIVSGRNWLKHCSEFWDCPHASDGDYLESHSARHELGSELYEKAEAGAVPAPAQLDRDDEHTLPEEEEGLEVRDDVNEVLGFDGE